MSFFIRHERRELSHLNKRRHPDSCLHLGQVIEATAWGRQPQALSCDRDKVYGDYLGSKLVGAGVADVRTPYRAPLANSVAERVVRTFRRECLDHTYLDRLFRKYKVHSRAALVACRLRA